MVDLRIGSLGRRVIALVVSVELAGALDSNRQAPGLPAFFWLSKLWRIDIHDFLQMHLRAARASQQLMPRYQLIPSHELLVLIYGRYKYVKPLKRHYVYIVPKVSEHP